MGSRGTKGKQAGIRHPEMIDPPQLQRLDISGDICPAGRGKDHQSVVVSAARIFYAMAWHSAGCPKEMPLTWWLTQHKAVYSAALSSSGGQNSVQSTCWPGGCGSQKVPFLFASPAGTVWVCYQRTLTSSCMIFLGILSNLNPQYSKSHHTRLLNTYSRECAFGSTDNIQSLILTPSLGFQLLITYLRVTVSIQGVPEEIEESKCEVKGVKIILQNFYTTLD